MSAQRAAAFCEPLVHVYLRRHPEDLLRLRPWRDIESDVGECPGCNTTLCVPWSEERKEVEGEKVING